MPQLALLTWLEVEERLQAGACALLPLGSTEQHGPMGLIGTDTICAQEIAQGAADLCDAVVAPAFCYTPAPFNTQFPGTLSLPEDLFERCLHEICQGLLVQGFKGVFLVNGHGANLRPARAVAQTFHEGALHVQSWWDPSAVAQMRAEMFGAWEGMHATPSEVAITQALHGCKPQNAAATPPRQLSAEYMKAHSGDRHGSPEAHRAAFPDGRVGSHSALATPALGAQLLKSAREALARDYRAFCGLRGTLR
ncbi:MAG: creatininase family protein [Pseudomonadota bacterium]